MGLLSYLRGDDLGVEESRSLSRANVPSPMLPYSRRALTNVSEANALGVTDAWACVKVLSDAVCALPPKVYRKTVSGRVPAGDDQRLVQLLRRPAPGATSADLFGTAMLHLLVNGNAFVGKFSSEGSIVALGLLDPSQVDVDLRGSRVVYRVSQSDGVKEVGPESVLHIRGMSHDGVRGVSPVAKARVALSLGSSLQEICRIFGVPPHPPLSVKPQAQSTPSFAPEGLTGR